MRHREFRALERHLIASRHTLSQNTAELSRPRRDAPSRNPGGVRARCGCNGAKLIRSPVILGPDYAGCVVRAKAWVIAQLPDTGSEVNFASPFN